MRASLLLVLLALPAAAQAQIWTGPAALEVRAEDNGKPAAGGEVRLEYLDMEPVDGPAPIPLDSRGRAVIGSLAEGHWRLEVSRPGAMTYRAEVLVRAGGKPQVINAVQHNVPGAVTMMEVKLARARGGAAPAPRQEAAAPTPRPEPVRPEPARPAPAPIPPAPQPEPQSPPREEAPAPVAQTATPPPTPVPIEREASAPAPAPETPPPPAPRPEPREEAPTPAPQPVTPPPAPAPVPVPEREAPTPAPTQAPPQPEPRPEPRRETPPPIRPAAPPQRLEPSPAPQPATPPPAAPAPAPAPGATLRRSAQDRTCAECKPGESSLSVEAVAPPAAGATGCGSGLREALLRRDVTGLPAGCQMLRLELPANARYIGYRYEIQDGGTNANCEAGKDCPSGDARWPMDPLLFRDGTGKTTVSAAFENRSADRERRAVLTVYFKEAGNPNAPRPMLQSRPRQDRPPG
ncbi:MAG: hypothetical protein ACJ759_15250 [Thermoanaerobaculia bacterium]